MELIDFIPFKSEFTKACHGLTTNATHTSEKPVFEELKVRRYDKPLTEISEFILNKIDHWIGWNLISEKTAVGGTTTIRAEISSFILFGLKINITFGILEEKDVNDRPITTVNAKAETHIESRGDLGESRRAIRMMLGAMDFEFRNELIKEEDYQYRSLDTAGASAASQQIFNDAQLQHQPKPEGSAKATTIEFKKRPAVQTIELKPTKKIEEISLTSTPISETPVQNETSDSTPEANTASDDPKPSKPKIVIVTTQKKPINTV
ncbi:MAG: hypothetical protein FDX21_05845 [Chlorobium sp.]|nr:MAG: hypothetical protein FDX21_05845 [Chlorobium sp.]